MLLNLQNAVQTPESFLILGPKRFLNSGSRLTELLSVFQMSQVSRIVFVIVKMVKKLLSKFSKIVLKVPQLSEL